MTLTSAASVAGVLLQTERHEIINVRMTLPLVASATEGRAILSFLFSSREAQRGARG
jgi:hypothetical protein